MSNQEGEKPAHSSLYQSDFTAEEFARRRKAVFDAIGDEAVAVVQGDAPGRGFDLFRQSNQFYYLCGVEVPQSYLLLDGRVRKTTLYFIEHEREASASEGAGFAAQDVEVIKAATGVDEIYDLAELSGHLSKVKVIYTPHRPAEGRRMSRDQLVRCDRAMASDPWDSQPTRAGRFIDLLRARCLNSDVRDLSPILDSLRIFKSSREVDILRRSARLTGLGLMEAARSTRPGIVEYQLGAVADYIYMANGAQGAGYRAIIASGSNIWHAHYFRNDCSLKDRELVLMDYSADYGYYTSDIGRMWPVNGKYSPVQRELYGLIVEYHKVLLKLIRPGVSSEQVTQEAAEEMRPVIEGMDFSKQIYREAALRLLDFKGHLSHGVGMAVHDVGRYKDYPLARGMVFAVDPQMWVPEEKVYIRVEDTVAVTDDGIENLTGFVPVELDDFERLMREDGLLQTLPPDALEGLP